MPIPTVGTRLFTTDQDFRILTWSDCDVAIVSGKKGETGRPEDMRLPSEEAVALFLEQWIASTLREGFVEQRDATGPVQSDADSSAEAARAWFTRAIVFVAGLLSVGMAGAALTDTKALDAWAWPALALYAGAGLALLWVAVTDKASASARGCRTHPVCVGVWDSLSRL